jgi:hypothetical protein
MTRPVPRTRLGRELLECRNLADCDETLALLKDVPLSAEAREEAQAVRKWLAGRDGR